MEWLTLGDGRNSITNNIKTLQALQRSFAAKNNDPIDYIQWLLTTDTADNFNVQLNDMGLSELATPITTAQLEKIVDKIQSQGSDQFKPLLYKLAELDANGIESDIEYTLFDSDNDTKQQNIGHLSLNLSGSADAKITFEGNGVAEPPEGKRAVSISFDGNLEAQLDAELPINVGAISGYANFSGSSHFNLQYMRPNNELFISSICTILDNDFNPLRLSAIKTNLANKDKSFDSVTIDLGGSLEYGADMKLGYKTNLTNVKSVVDASVNIGFASTIAGQFKLEIAPDSENQNHIIVSVKRAQQRSDSSSIGATVSVDAGNVADAVADKIEAKLAGPSAKLKEAIDKINALHTPGEIVEQELTALISSSSLGETTTSQLLASTKLMLGTVDEQTAAKALTEKLNNELKRHYLIWGEDTPSRVEAFVTALANNAGVSESIIDKLKPQITNVLTKIDNAFDSKLQAIAKDSADEITTTLSQMGAQYQRIIAAPVTQVTKAKNALIKALTDYQSRVNEFVETITDKEKYKLEASISSKLTETSSSDLMLEYRFDLNQTDLTELQHCFELLLRGKAKQIFALKNIAGLEVIAGELTTQAGIAGEQGVHMSFFGLDLDYKNILNINSKVVQNAAGDVTALSEADYKSQFGFGGIKQSAEFANTFNIAIAEGSTLDLNFAMTVGDSKLSIDDLDNVLDELTHAGILKPALAEQIGDDHQLMCGNNSKVNALINFKLVLNNWQAGDLLGVTLNEKETHQRRFIEAFSAQLENSNTRQKRAKLIRALRIKDIPNVLAIWAYQNKLYSNQGATPPAITRARLNSVYDDIKQYAGKAYQYAQMCLIMRKLYLTNNAEITADDLTEQQQALNACLKPWLISFADLFNLGRPTIATQTRTFAKALITSAGQTQPLSLSAEAVYKKKTFNYR